VTAFVAGRAGAVGKVPWRPEFLPVPTSAPSFAAFDAWLTDATEWAAAGAGPGWPAAFAQGVMHGFVYRSETDPVDAALCGALAPSRDSAGRQFPLALGAPLRFSPELLRRPELLPFILEGSWSEATGALAELLTAGVADPSAPARLDAGHDAEVSESALLYDDWVATLPLVELWALLGPSLADPVGTVRLLLETLAPSRGVERPRTTLSLRLPLGLAGGAALCFWLDLVRRYVGWQSTIPSLFWSHDGTHGAALLHLGRPSKGALVELWLPSGKRDDAADMTVPPDPAWLEAFSPLPSAVSAVLGSPHATAAHLLAAIGA
jgi:type VI secretion system ImpM family protein